MSEIKKALDAAYKKAGNQNRAAKELNIPAQHLSNAYNGHRSLSSPQIKRLAEYIGKDFFTLYGKVKAEWKNIAACLILGLGLTSLPANDLQAKTSVVATDLSIHYAK